MFKGNTYKIPTSHQVFQKIELEQIKYNYKTWMQLSLILFIAFTIEGRVINAPQIPISKMLLWGISYILIILLGTISTYKFYKTTKKLSKFYEKL